MIDSIERSRDAASASRSAEREVHVWRVPLGDHRQRAVREILSRYVDTPAGEIRFSYGPHGKPEIADVGSSAAPTHLSLAHSGDLALLAVSRAGPIGIDVEKLDLARPFAQIADRCFGRAERDALVELRGHDRARAFYRVWCAKEAYLKATGIGISVPLRSVEVGSVLTLDLGPSYVGAVAASAGRALGELPLVVRRGWRRAPRCRAHPTIVGARVRGGGTVAHRAGAERFA